MDKKINILWLPAWFPSRVDFLSGDFTERYALAVSAFRNVTVLYVSKDVSLIKKRKEIEIERKDNLVVYRAYYSGKDVQGRVGKFISVTRYYVLLFSLYKKAKKERGNFTFVHIHVPLRQCLLAIWLKLKSGLNYVITEQNTWYTSHREGFFSTSLSIQRMIKYVFQNALKVHTVSFSLGEQLIKAKLIKNTFTVIPNVVNTAIFKPPFETKKTETTLINFVAVNSDIFHKNTDGIIRSFEDFLVKGHIAVLHIVGPNFMPLKQLVKNLGIETNVVFYGALSNQNVASVMQQCDAMIFFTRFETFGCVMAEALCCGMPVIASRLPVLEENLIEFENALFVNPEDENDLTDKLLYFTEHRFSFDNKKIAESAKEKYNFSTVAKEMLDFYASVEHDI